MAKRWNVTLQVTLETELEAAAVLSSVYELAQQVWAEDGYDLHPPAMSMDVAVEDY